MPHPATHPTACAWQQRKEPGPHTVVIRAEGPPTLHLGSKSKKTRFCPAAGAPKANRATGWRLTLWTGTHTVTALTAGSLRATRTPNAEHWPRASSGAASQSTVPRISTRLDAQQDFPPLKVGTDPKKKGDSNHDVNFKSQLRKGWAHPTTFLE